MQIQIRYLLVVVLLCLGLSVHSQKDDDNIFVHSLILDKTRSMIGEGDGGGVDIWQDVIDAMIEYINTVDKGDMLLLTTFDARCSEPIAFEVVDDMVREDAKEFIRSIRPDGSSTAIYSALKQTFGYLKANHLDARKLIYLFTDGHDNISSVTFDEALSVFDAIKGEYDHCYYVDLRDKAPSDIKETIANNPSISISKGLMPLITVHPKFLEISSNITSEVTYEVSQIFEVSGGKINDATSFKTDIKSSSKANLDIIPSTVSIGDLEELGTNKYEWKFKLRLVGGKLEDNTLATVTLTPMYQTNTRLTFAPASFKIVFDSPPSVKGGWE